VTEAHSVGVAMFRLVFVLQTQFRFYDAC